MPTFNNDNDTDNNHNLSTKLTADDLKRLTDTNQLAQPWPAPILKATLKRSPADFRVDEIMDIALSSEGEHLWVHIQKTGLNTAYVAEQLAKWANIPKRDVGYSGMKDRQAVTTQWFSLRMPKKQLPKLSFENYLAINGINTPASLSSTPIAPNNTQKTDDAQQIDNAPHSDGLNDAEHTETISVLTQTWHGKKLNRGTHRANHFAIVLHDIQLDSAVASSHKEVDTILATIAKRGVPNYFGGQRFGRNGNNITQALEWFEQGTINGRRPKSKKDHELQSLLLSAARSAIFNQILNARVENDSWDTGLDGEVFNLEGTGSVFTTERIDDTLKQRLIEGDIHPTAPLWGINNDKVAGIAKAIEEATVHDDDVLKALAGGLINKKIKTMRRALRLSITDFSWHWVDATTLVLTFTLPTGAFATSVLASIASDLRS